MKNQSLMEEYLETIRGYDEAIARDDKKSINSIYARLKKIYTDNVNDSKFINVLEAILSMPNVPPSACLWAAAHLLGAKASTEAAEAALVGLVARKDIGITSFDAEMTLKTWRKQGYLKF